MDNKSFQVLGECSGAGCLDLWTRYTQHKDHRAREALILNYARLVKYVVGRLALSLPGSLDQGDLVGYGTIGLIEAVDRYDPSRGVKFETYAAARIRGHIIDALRTLDLLPRSARRRAKEIENAISQLSQSLGRIPTDKEVAEHLGVSMDQYQARLLDAACAIVSLDEPVGFEDGEPYELYTRLEDVTMPGPSEQIESRETLAQLASAIRSLPEREQLMISLYYNDRLTMKEIGQVLGVSEPRVSQLHAKAMLTLRGLMKPGDESSSAIREGGRTYASVYAVAR
jgi:RNA polymerase sigma factor for flagellar operon FliA